MTYLVTVTSQGQISIPAKLRRSLRLDRARVAISEEKGKLILEAVPDLLSLGGSLKTNKKPLSNKQLHELFAKAMAEDYARSIK